MPLSSTSRPAIRGRVIPRVPATLTATGGISVTKVNGIWTIAPDWNDLTLLDPLPADLSTVQLWAFNPDTEVFSRISAESLVGDLEFEPLGEVSAINQKADDFTFDIDDKGAIVESTKATAMTGTIPPNSSVAFPVKTRIDLLQYGAGQLSVAAGAGVTIRSADGRLNLRTQYVGASLYQRAADEWVLVGDLTA